MSIRVGIRHLGRPIRVIGPWAGAELTRFYDAMNSELFLQATRFQSQNKEVYLFATRFQSQNSEVFLQATRFQAQSSEVAGV